MVLHNFYPNTGWVDLPIILFCLPILGLSLQRPLSQGAVSCLHHWAPVPAGFQCGSANRRPWLEIRGQKEEAQVFFFPAPSVPWCCCVSGMSSSTIPMLSKPWAPWVPVLNTDDVAYHKHLINAHLGVHPLLILLAPLQGITLLKCICWALTNIGRG